MSNLIEEGELLVDQKQSLDKRAEAFLVANGWAKVSREPWPWFKTIGIRELKMSLWGAVRNQIAVLKKDQTQDASKID